MRIKLVEQQIVKSNEELFQPLMQLLQVSNNLANTALYVNRQHYFHMTNQKYTEDIASDVESTYVNYNTLDKLLKKHNDKNYRKLPANTAQEVLKAVELQWKSFFESNKLFKAGKLENKPNIPKYRTKGSTFNLVYNRMTFGSQKSFYERGEFYIPKTKYKIKINHYQTCKQIRVIPKNNYLVIENVYEVDVADLKTDNKRYLSIDLGINNLATCVSNVSNAFIIDGRYIKSINQFYNKEVARLYQIHDNSNQKKSSKRINNLSLYRNNVIKDCFHKASRYIVDYALENNINTIVIGKNTGWKDECNIGKVNNQNFVQIPFNKLIDYISYKAKIVGINVVLQEESYTSKNSFFDDDYLPTYGVDDEKNNPSGRRIERGLYKTKDGFKFNADSNGSLNILRKYLQVNAEGCNIKSSDIIPETIRGFVINPVRLRFNEGKIQ